MRRFAVAAALLLAALSLALLFHGPPSERPRYPPAASAPQSPRDRSMLRRGLQWLARHQEPDGRWSSARSADPCAAGGREGYDAATTGISLLAFLGAGYTHSTREEYVDPVTGRKTRIGAVVEAGLRWLAEGQDQDGWFRSSCAEGAVLNQAIGAAALTEAQGLSANALLTAPARKAVDALVSARSEDGGWGERPRAGKSDAFVTVWAVMALRTAELSGRASLRRRRSSSSTPTATRSTIRVR